MHYIKYIGSETVNDIITPLFDPKDLDNDTKINTAIKHNFIGEITDPLPEHCHYAELTNMLDFSLTDFKKVINLNPQQNTDIETKWDLVKLGEVVNIIRGVTYNKNKESITPTSKIILTADNITLDGTFTVKKQIFLNDSIELDDKKRLMADDIFICFSSGSKKHVGKIAYIKQDTEYYAGGFMGILRNKETDSLNKYLFELLNLETYRNVIRNTGTGSNINNLSSTLEEIKISLPPPHTQQKIVDECETVDQETAEARQTIAATKQKIEELVSSAEKTSRLNQVVARISNTVNPKEENGVVHYVGLENIESQTGVLLGDVQSDYSTIKSNKNVFRRGDILYGKLRPNLNKVYLANIDGICSTDILVLRPYNPNLATFYKHYFLSEAFNSEVVTTVSGQQLPRTSWEKINRIPVPPPNIQQQLVAEIEQLETEITQAQAVIDNATERKSAILAKYL